MTKKIIYIILIIFLTVAIVSFGIFFYNKYRIKQNNLNVNLGTSTNTTSTDFITVTLPSEPSTTPQWYATDKDGDGLTDDEEDKFGTNKWEPDSDFDDISDKLEVEKYHTDPMNADTDGDGYRDGVEILNGFDPLKK